MRTAIEHSDSGWNFIKYARDGNGTQNALLQEAFLARQAANANHPRYGQIAPDVVGHSDKLIAFEYLQDYRSCRSGLHESPRDSTFENRNLAFKIGEVLGFIQSWPFTRDANPELPSSFPLDIDSYVRINPSALRILVDLCPETHEALGQMKSYLETSQAQWRFIHGDFKPDNILVGSGNLRVVDWELAGGGPAEHDFASFYAGVFTEALHEATVKKSDGGLGGIALEAVTLTRQVMQGYRTVETRPLDGTILSQLIGTKLLVRTCMNAYLTVGSSPMIPILQKAAESCLIEPQKLATLLFAPA